MAAEPSGLIAKLLAVGSERDPVEELRRLEPVLQVLEAHLILFIEDADRAGSGFDSRHLERLLFSLRSVQRISFVLSFDQTRTKIDYKKLCDVIESVPAMNVERVRRLLALTYKHWREDFVWIDPLGDRLKRNALTLAHSDNPMLAYSYGLSQDTPIHAMTALLQTPRNLKHFLRRTEIAWRRLHGEVDLDDIIVLNAIREGSPAVFDFLVANIDPARHKPEELSARTQTVRGDWDKLLGKLPERDSIRRLVHLLGITQLTDRKGPALEQKPQGVQRFRDSMDYFTRAQSETLAPTELKDQTVLREIADWQTTRSGGMAARLQSPPADDTEYLQAWEDFAFFFSNDELLELGTALVDSVLREEGARAAFDHPGLLAVWRCFNKQIRSDSLPGWINAQVGKVLPISLNFANELLGYFASKEARITTVTRQSIRDRFVAEVKARLNTPVLLTRALAPERPATLNFLIMGPERQRLEPLDSWQDYASVIADAAIETPILFAPQLAILLSESSLYLERHGEGDQMGTREKVNLNEDRLNELFGSRADDVLQVLANATGDHPYVIALSKEARSRLAAEPGDTARTADPSKE